jgi:hypothetical protein
MRLFLSLLELNFIQRSKDFTPTGVLNLMTLTGILGADLMRKHGVEGPVSDTELRAWRDYLEERLRLELQLDADFAIGPKTQFKFTTPSDSHTIIEIEAFARKALDKFLDDRENRGRVSSISS